MIQVQYCVRCNQASYYKKLEKKYTCYKCQIALKLIEKNINMNGLPRIRKKNKTAKKRTTDSVE